jgi:F0F1-type ATP synthase epsilon subunit
MPPGALALEIVTPDGVALQETDVEVVVFHRREPRFEPGSEIAIFPLHGPLLVRAAVAPARFRKGGRTVHLALGGGFAEVLGDTVVIATPRLERLSPEEANPLRVAREVCRGWREEAGQLQFEMVGSPEATRAGKADKSNWAGEADRAVRADKVDRTDRTLTLRTQNPEPRTQNCAPSGHRTQYSGRHFLAYLLPIT